MIVLVNSDIADIRHFFLCIPNTSKLITDIKPRTSIILFFFMGGFVGGFLYSKLDLKLNTLVFGAVTLLVSSFYGDFRYNLIRTRRRYAQRKAVQKLGKPRKRQIFVFFGHLC